MEKWTQQKRTKDRSDRDDNKKKISVKRGAAREVFRSSMVNFAFIVIMLIYSISLFFISQWLFCVCMRVNLLRIEFATSNSRPFAGRAIISNLFLFFCVSLLSKWYIMYWFCNAILPILVIIVIAVARRPSSSLFIKILRDIIKSRIISYMVKTKRNEMNGFTFIAMTDQKELHKTVWKIPTSKLFASILFIKLYSFVKTWARAHSRTLDTTIAHKERTEKKAISLEKIDDTPTKKKNNTNERTNGGLRERDDRRQQMEVNKNEMKIKLIPYIVIYTKCRLAIFIHIFWCLLFVYLFICLAAFFFVLFVLFLLLYLCMCLYFFFCPIYSHISHSPWRRLQRQLCITVLYCFYLTRSFFFFFLDGRCHAHSPRAT